MSKLKMKAPAGAEGGTATIEGHEYSIPKTGVLSVISSTHVETLRRHGFVDILQDEELEKELDDMDKDELIEYIDEHGGDADPDLSKKKLLAQAKKIAAEAE